MFSLQEIDSIAWVLFLLMGGWIVVNALVDLSGDRAPFSDSTDDRATAEDPRDKRD
jgi:hypothetical protein